MEKMRNDKNMNKKPSFLERLTGVMEEEEETKSVPLNKAEKKEPEEEEIKTPLRPKDNEVSKKEKKITLPPEPEKTTQEWLPDSEGQLTIDVYQTPTDIVIKSTIAGVSPEDLDITITNDMVTIKGKREKDEVISGGDYYYQECYWGAFSRSVILPVDVEAEKADASMKNGILTIRLPKIEKIKTKKIRVVSN
jgi:HSP20 family protein